jgi:hypothetical protein
MGKVPSQVGRPYSRMDRRDRSTGVGEERHQLGIGEANKHKRISRCG